MTADLVDLHRDANVVAVLTGAGMSAECGIPVFRGPGGLWEGFRPEELATPEAFAADPARVWRWYRWRLERVRAAEPHAGYHALAGLEGNPGGVSLRVVTQNVDGLHSRSGSREVVELHGNLTRARCDACGARTDAEAVDPDDPACACGKGRLRPDVVWFGESLDARNLERAAAHLEAADVVWLVGTSSVVYPAAALPGLAARRGIPVIEINPEATPLSHAMSACVRAPASRGLAEVVAALGAAREGGSL